MSGNPAASIDGGRSSNLSSANNSFSRTRNNILSNLEGGSNTFAATSERSQERIDLMGQPGRHQKASMLEPGRAETPEGPGEYDAMKLKLQATEGSETETRGSPQTKDTMLQTRATNFGSNSRVSDAYLLDQNSKSASGR